MRRLSGLLLAGALMMLPLACALVYVGSLRRSVTRRKLVAILIAALGGEVFRRNRLTVRRIAEAPP